MVLGWGQIAQGLARTEYLTDKREGPALYGASHRRKERTRSEPIAEPLPNCQSQHITLFISLQNKVSMRPSPRSSPETQLLTPNPSISWHLAFHTDKRRGLRRTGPSGVCGHAGLPRSHLHTAHCLCPAADPRHRGSSQAPITRRILCGKQSGDVDHGGGNSSGLHPNASQSAKPVLAHSHLPLPQTSRWPCWGSWRPVATSQGWQQNALGTWKDKLGTKSGGHLETNREGRPEKPRVEPRQIMSGGCLGTNVWGCCPGHDWVIQRPIAEGCLHPTGGSPGDQ